MEAKITKMMVKSIDEKKRRLNMIASCGTMDRSNEIIHPKAYVKTIAEFMKNPVLLQAHDYSQPSVGKFLNLEVTKEGLEGTVEFAPTEMGKEYWELYKGGYQSAFSVGFMPLKCEDVTEAHAKEGKIEFLIEGEKEETIYQAGLQRVFTEVELLETSCVPVPCNRESLTQLGIKALASLKKQFEPEKKEKGGPKEEVTPISCEKCEIDIPEGEECIYEDKKYCKNCFDLLEKSDPTDRDDDQNLCATCGCELESPSETFVVDEKNYCRSCYTGKTKKDDDGKTSKINVEVNMNEFKELMSKITDDLKGMFKAFYESADNINENIISLGNQIERNLNPKADTDENGKPIDPDLDEKMKKNTEALSSLIKDLEKKLS